MLWHALTLSRFVSTWLDWCIAETERKKNTKSERRSGRTKKTTITQSKLALDRARLHRWVYYALMKSTKLLLNCRMKLNFVSFHFFHFVSSILIHDPHVHELRDILGRSVSLHFSSFYSTFDRNDADQRSRKGSMIFFLFFLSFV